MRYKNQNSAIIECWKLVNLSFTCFYSLLFKESKRVSKKFVLKNKDMNFSKIKKNHLIFAYPCDYGLNVCKVIEDLNINKINCMCLTCNKKLLF